VRGLQHVLRKPLMSLLADTILQSIRPAGGFAMDGVIVFLSWLVSFVKAALSLLGASAR
jgi:hypothetical protein